MKKDAKEFGMSEANFRTIEKVVTRKPVASHGEMRDLVAAGLAKLDRDWSTTYTLTDAAQEARHYFLRLHFGGGVR